MSHTNCEVFPNCFYAPCSDLSNKWPWHLNLVTPNLQQVDTTRTGIQEGQVHRTQRRRNFAGTERTSCKNSGKEPVINYSAEG